MIELIIILLIVIICYQSAITSIHDRCVNNKEVFIKFIQGIRINEKKDTYSILPTIKILLTDEIPCGVYLSQTKYGIATLFIGYYNKKICNIYFHRYSPQIHKESILYFYNIQRIINNKDLIINTFNSGCCKQ